MKKITTLSLLLGATTMFSNAQNINNCNELFISEYVEGSQKNQAIEIYNPTENDIGLSKYALKIYKNGNANNPTVIQFAGTILAKDVFVCGNAQAEAAVIAVCDITTNSHDYSGDDAIGLYKNDTLIDMIGEIGVNPGNTGWQVGIGSTKDQTLVRKFDIRGGTPYWTQSVFEWIVKPMDDFSNLGTHSSVTVDEDRIVLVIFHDPLITEGEVTVFAQNNDLILEHKPSSTLPTYTWSYTFRLGAAKCNIDPVSAANQIMLNEPSVVKFAQENKTYSFDQCFTVVNEMGLDTTAPNRMWHIENSGDVVIDTLSGIIDADADICDCWDAGYTGNGIRVAVIDGQGYQLTHEDVIGLPRTYILPIWDCFVDTPQIGFNDFIYNTTNAHAMLTSGLIAGARANNNKGIAGVAKDAKIIPILMNNIGTNEIKNGIQAALRPEYDADVINMSFGTTFNDSIVHNEIIGAVTTGRNGLGCVIVASAGNSDTAAFPFYPAAFDEVIGVGGSNPNDFRAERGDGWIDNLWGSGQGSNFGAFYEVVAPATAMTSLDFKGSFGFNTSGDYFTATGTSFSAPVVSGIAAILLEKNPTLTWQEVREAIIKGAEKVHSVNTGGIYDYNFDPLDPGRSFEMQYGRVSCINSLDSISVGVGIEEASIDNQLFDLIYVYNNNSELTVVYDLKNKQGDMVMKVYDMLGREMKAHLLPCNNNRAVFSIEGFAKGMYVLGFYSKQGDKVKSHKFVRY